MTQEPNESLSSWGMWHVPDEVHARAKQFEPLAAYVKRQQENAFNMGDASKEGAGVEMSADAVLQPSPTNKESE